MPSVTLLGCFIFSCEPSEDHKAFDLVSKKKKQKVMKTKRKFHTDDEKMALMTVIEGL